MLSHFAKTNSYGYQIYFYIFAVPYAKMDTESKCIMMLTWVVGNRTNAEQICGLDMKVADSTMVDLLPDSLRDKLVDVKSMKDFFQDDVTWDKFLSNVKTLKKRKWKCVTCAKNLQSKGRSVQCDRCLSWSHFACSKIKKNHPNLEFYCKMCKVEISEGISH